MNPVKSFFEARRERKIERQVESLANDIFVTIRDAVGTEEVGPIKHEVGPKPRSLTGSEYLSRIDGSVSRRLGMFGLSESVNYDPDVSMHLSTERTPHISEGNWTLQTKDILTIVYQTQ